MKNYYNLKLNKFLFFEWVFDLNSGRRKLLMLMDYIAGIFHYPNYFLLICFSIYVFNIFSGKNKLRSGWMHTSYSMSYWTLISVTYNIRKAIKIIHIYYILNNLKIYYTYCHVLPCTSLYIYSFNTIPTISSLSQDIFGFNRLLVHSKAENIS